MIRKAVLENCQTLSTLQCILKMNTLTLTTAIHYVQISRAPRVATSVFLTQEWNANTAICQTLEIHSYLLMHKRPSWELVCNRVNEQLNHFSDYDMTGAGRAETRQEWRSNLFGGCSLPHQRSTVNHLSDVRSRSKSSPPRGQGQHWPTDCQADSLTLRFVCFAGTFKGTFHLSCQPEASEVEPRPTAVRTKKHFEVGIQNNMHRNKPLK